jgi:hemerythrin-like domain-containing protein
MPDVFDVLSKDHNEVKEMLAQLEKEQPGPDAAKAKLARRKEMVDKLITEESRHEAVEEMFFWPAVRDKLRDGDKLADTAIGQEDEGNEVLSKLDKLDAGNPEFEKLLSEFVKAGREHIEFEETQVWPNMRKALSKQEASEMGKQIQEGKKTAPTRPQPGHTPGQGKGKNRPGAEAASGGKTRDELYEEARKLGVEGRSSMNKEELGRHVAEGH